MRTTWINLDIVLMLLDVISICTVTMGENHEVANQIPFDKVDNLMLI